MPAPATQEQETGFDWSRAVPVTADPSATATVTPAAQSTQGPTDTDFDWSNAKSPSSSVPIGPTQSAAAPAWPEGFWENFSHVVTGVAHPASQAGSELQSLTDHPLSTLGAATKQAAKSLLIDLPTALVYHPLDTLKTITGGTDFEAAVKRGDTAGALGALAGGISNALMMAEATKPGSVTGLASDSYGTAKSALLNAKSKLADAFIEPEEPIPSAPTPKPVTPHVAVDTPFDDATIRKIGGKDLGPEARDTLQQAAGDTIQAGSSAQNHLLNAVAPINDTITKQGLALNKILETAPPLRVSPLGEVTGAVEDLKDKLAGGTEESLGKAMDKEVFRVQKGLSSNDPVEVNAVKRDLDSRINSFTAPEEPINTPAEAADAARVVMRRAISAKLSAEIPQTQPINAELAQNLEARSFLDKKLGDIARDPVAADAQHSSELAKGKTILQNQAADQAAQGAYQQKLADVQKNVSRLKWGAGTVAGLGLLHDKISQVLGLL